MMRPLLLIALTCGPALAAPRNGDFDENGTRDIGDVTAILQYLFREGPSPTPIVARRGLPTTDVVSCQGAAGPIVCPAPGAPSPARKLIVPLLRPPDRRLDSL